MTCLALLLILQSPLQADQSADWLTAKISVLQQQPVGNPPARIIQRSWQGQIYYYLPAQCCDQFSSLYSATGTFICAPDGGFAGVGDGHCPEFVSHMTDDGVIWEDKR